MIALERVIGPPQRAGMVQVLDAPTTGLVRKMTDVDVNAAIRRSLSLPLEEDPRAYGIMTRHVNSETAGLYIPSWLNLRGLIQLVNQVTAFGNLREPVLAAAEDEQQAVLRFLNKPNLDEGITELKEANERVAGTSITHAILGAVVGRNIDKVINRHEMIKTPDQMVFYKPTIALAVAVEIGDRFVTPAESSEELLDRIQIVVPNPDDELRPAGNTLQELFIKHNVFDNTNSQGKVTCPAIHKTGVMLRVFGQVLATYDDFRQRVLGTLQN